MKRQIFVLLASFFVASCGPQTDFSSPVTLQPSFNPTSSPTGQLATRVPSPLSRSTTAPTFPYSRVATIVVDGLHNFDLSPDGSKLAIHALEDSGSTLSIYGSLAWTQEWTTSLEGSIGFDIGFSPDNSLVYASGGGFRAWTLDAGELVLSVDGAEFDFAELMPDNSTLLSGYWTWSGTTRNEHESHVFLRPIAQNEQARVLPHRVFEGIIQGLVLNKEGTLAALSIAPDDHPLPGQVLILDVTDFSTVCSLADANSADFGKADGDSHVAVGLDAIRIIEVPDCREVHSVALEMAAPTDFRGVLDLAFLSDEILAVVAGQSAVLYWRYSEASALSPPTGILTRSDLPLKNHLAASEDGRIVALVAANPDGSSQLPNTIEIWKVAAAYPE